MICPIRFSSRISGLLHTRSCDGQSLLRLLVLLLLISASVLAAVALSLDMRAGWLDRQAFYIAQARGTVAAP